MAHDVFISHSAKEKTIADAVCATLEARGIRCWIAPRDILPSQDWDTAIISAIKSSRVMVLIFSAHSNDSIQVHREVKAAFKKGITVVPLRLDNAELNESLEFFMGLVHWLDAMTPPLERHLAHLAEVVETLLGIAVNRTPSDLIEPNVAAESAAGLPSIPNILPVPTPPATQSAEFVNSIGMRFKLIPAGEFWMGSPESEFGRREDERRHRVRITKPFYMAIYQVTQAEFEAVMRYNPSFFITGGDLARHFPAQVVLVAERVSRLDTSRFPVEMVTWADAQQFCQRLSEYGEERSVGRRYRLPTEAEWEYSCRARTDAPFSFGDQLNGQQANCDGNHPYGTTRKGPYLERTAAVGSYPPNDFGLHEMHGNVWEWCADWCDPAYYANSPIDDPQGASSGPGHIVRGGSWYSRPAFVRCAHRGASKSSAQSFEVGFRVACDVG